MQDAAGSATSTPTAPKIEVGRVVGPLLTYHVLILGGALLLLAGYARGDALWMETGAILIVAGIVVEFAILWWTASMIRHAPHSRTEHSAAATAAAPIRSSRLCTACGWKGHTRSPLCPRCQKLTVLLP
ncbi:MAG: hypothetical protein WA549_00350 [Thermoplasmata archaeon]